MCVCVCSHLKLPKRSWPSILRLTAFEVPTRLPALLATLGDAPPTPTALSAPPAAAAAEPASAAEAEAEAVREAAAPAAAAMEAREQADAATVTGSSRPRPLSAPGQPATASRDGDDGSVSSGSGGGRQQPQQRAPSGSTRRATQATRTAPAACAVKVVFELLVASVGGSAGDVAHDTRFYDARARLAVRRCAGWLRLGRCARVSWFVCITVTPSVLTTHRVSTDTW